MKFQSMQNDALSSNNRLFQCNFFQLSLLSSLLLNLAMTLYSPSARAVEPALTELTPGIAVERSRLETPSTADLTTAAELSVSNDNSSNPDQLSPEVSPPSASTTFAEITPTPQNISKQASDLLGESTSQNIAQETPAQTENQAPSSSSDAKPVNNPLLPPPGWRFDFEPYLFLPLDVKGDIFFGKGRNLLFPNRPGGENGGILGNRGINLNVNARLSDIRAQITNLFGISGRLQAWNGNFGIVADGLYVNSGLRGSSDSRTFTFRDRFDISIPGFQIDTKNTLSSFSLGASYRLVTVPFRTITDPSNPSQYFPAISVEALAGFRYLSVFQSVEFERGPRFEFSGSEFNPMLGTTVKLMLSDRFSFVFRGDTSNLGGGNLKQYYNLYGGIDWKFSGSFALRLAYRFNQIEFVKKGPFGGDNGLNLRSQGVQLGISWQF